LLGWLPTLLALAAPGQAQDLRMVFADKVRMVDCSPASDIPCFRLKANIVDAEGAPAAPPLPNPELLASRIAVRLDRLERTPFYAGVGGAQVEQQSRTALIVIDTSGSMSARLPSGQTRFEGAQSAALRFLDGFENGKDRVAIVRFDSHEVVQTIRSARFATTVEGARQQIEALPAPILTNNTALYSAVDAGLDVLTGEAAAARGADEVMLIVMTDGKNDVQAGDDPGLLGPEGLDIVAQKVSASGLQVIAVGLGNSQSIDVPALDRISTRHYLVSDEESLSRVFTFARTLLLNRLQVTLTSPWPDRASLAGKSMRVSLSLNLPNGQKIDSEETVWSTPQMGLPIYEGTCDAAELKALLANPDVPTGGGWWGLARPILVFVGIGALILVLWFWVPRLVWPEQYVGQAPVVASRGRWAGQTQLRRSGGGVAGGNAPPGFAAQRRGDAASPQRLPGDKTVVQPRAPSGRTRLGNRSQHDQFER
jgi:Ca-activated chloride channel family protein